MAARDSQAFSRWLRDRIALSGMSTTAFARRVMFNPATLSHWLSGRRTPRASSLVRLAEALGEDVAHLASLAGFKLSDEQDDRGYVGATILRNARARAEAATHLESARAALYPLEDRPEGADAALAIELVIPAISSAIEVLKLSEAELRSDPSRWEQAVNHSLALLESVVRMGAYNLSTPFSVEAATRAIDTLRGIVG